ncbi:MAG TPA: hypothetical protein VHW44_06215 [Pseudonocardiaceae bacterium]|jgi:hypothetical protein|nr:hypothetical protein [Pseudonocardiaceae bacterium]
MTEQRSAISTPVPEIDEFSTPIAPPRVDLLRPIEGARRPARPRWPNAVSTIIFGAVELWALVVVLTTLHPSGVLKVALSCVLAGAVMAIYLAGASFRGTRSPARHRADQRRSQDWPG